MTLTRAFAVGLLLTAGCRTTPRHEYHFPAAFDALQVVEVAQKEAKHTVLASVSRRGGNLDVTLLDPVLQTPLFVLSAGEGRRTSQALVPMDLNEKHLDFFMDALVELFSTSSFLEATDAILFEGRHLRFALEETRGGACSLPRLIRVKPRRGDDFAATVTTQEVHCP